MDFTLKSGASFISTSVLQLRPGTWLGENCLVNRSPWGLIPSTAKVKDLSFERAEDYFVVIVIYNYLMLFSSFTILGIFHGVEWITLHCIIWVSDGAHLEMNAQTTTWNPLLYHKLLTLQLKLTPEVSQSRKNNFYPVLGYWGSMAHVPTERALPACCWHVSRSAAMTQMGWVAYYQGNLWWCACLWLILLTTF